MPAAWVTNTQTGALYRYDGLPWRSTARLGGTVLALGDDGFFALDGHDDDDVPIQASMTTGALDLGDETLKRLGDMRFGYTSDGTLSCTIEQLGPQPQSVTYTLPARTADEPGTGRIVPGKGLRARYFRFTFANVSGACIEINNISLDAVVLQGRRI